MKEIHIDRDEVAKWIQDNLGEEKLEKAGIAEHILDHYMEFTSFVIMKLMKQIKEVFGIETSFDVDLEFDPD